MNWLKVAKYHWRADYGDTLQGLSIRELFYKYVLPTTKKLYPNFPVEHYSLSAFQNMSRYNTGLDNRRRDRDTVFTNAGIQIKALTQKCVETFGTETFRPNVEALVHRLHKWYFDESPSKTLVERPGRRQVDYRKLHELGIALTPAQGKMLSRQQQTGDEMQIIRDDFMAAQNAMDMGDNQPIIDWWAVYKDELPTPLFDNSKWQQMRQQYQPKEISYPSKTLPGTTVLEDDVAPKSSCNWYNILKMASLIDSVNVVSATGGSLVIFINGRRYEYSGVPGTYWDGEIRRWKAWKNKRAAGERLSNLIKNLDRYKVDQPEHPKPAQPQQAPQPQQANAGRAGKSILNWYKVAFGQHSSHPVLCYGCNQTRRVDNTTWMSKRSDPGGWRCELCQSERLAERPWFDETAKDRSAAQEYNYRIERNNRRGRF